MVHSNFLKKRSWRWTSNGWPAANRNWNHTDYRWIRSGPDQMLHAIAHALEFKQFFVTRNIGFRILRYSEKWLGISLLLFFQQLLSNFVTHNSPYIILISRKFLIFMKIFVRFKSKILFFCFTSIHSYRIYNKKFQNILYKVRKYYGAINLCVVGEIVLYFLFLVRFKNVAT